MEREDKKTNDSDWKVKQIENSFGHCNRFFFLLVHFFSFWSFLDNWLLKNWTTFNRNDDEKRLQMTSRNDNKTISRMKP